MNDRDMYYGSYGYGGMMPMNGMQTQMPNMANPFVQDTYSNSQIQDMNERINRLERQVKRLDQRLTRLETPYSNPNYQNYSNDPDNNMYMM